MINMTTEEFKTALYALVDDEHTVITNSAISDGISLIDGKINIHNVKITSEHFIFGDGSNKTRLITYADLTGVDVSSVTDLSSCFNDYGGLSLGLDISNWNTSNVTNMAYMFFRYCGTSLDLSELDTSNVISMSSMFDGCTANVLNLSSFDTSSVTDTTDMFRGCTTTRIVVDVDKWTLDTSSGVFYNYNGKVYIGDTEIMTKANSDRDIATSLNSALANYDNISVTAEKYYNKTEIDTKNSYSTSEIDTGKTWIDGKKIYKKTISLSITIPTSDWVNIIDVSSLNIGSFYRFTEIQFLVNNESKWMFEMVHIANAFSLVYNSNNGYIQSLNLNTSHTYNVKTLTIEYTKTTD